MTWFRGMERRGTAIHWIDASLPIGEKVDAILRLEQQDVGFSGFTVGAGYTLLDRNVNGRKNDQAFELGVGYENGPYAVSADYFVSKNGKVNGDKRGKFQKYEVSGKYKLGAGVDAFATFAYIDLNDRAALGPTGDLDKVWTVITGLALTF